MAHLNIGGNFVMAAGSSDQGINRVSGLNTHNRKNPTCKISSLKKKMSAKIKFSGSPGDRRPLG